MVNKNTIDASVLAKMFLAGAKNLEAKKEWINELNVFPVPDGDTGTNMTLTIHGCGRRSQPDSRCDYGKIGQGYFFGLSARCPREFGSDSLPASKRVYPKCF